MTYVEIGALALMAAFVASAFGAVAAPLGARRGHVVLVDATQWIALTTAALLILAVALLEAALVGHDFGLAFVADTTNRAMPLSYLVASLWGGQAGSLLYWCLALCLLSAIATEWTRVRHPRLHADALGALLGAQAFFLGLVALLANPFERLAIVPPDGRGLNPLLMDDGMRIHPPLLLAGYASFAVPFALAVAGLAQGRLDEEWRRALRPWALLSWTLQGAGLLLGAWWAYHVLGWGGYWGWDPVENAALLPWLVATALLHSLLVQERRGLMRLWNAGLALAGFCLAVFGTFAVRSGILSSVHAFADSPLGPLFFGFLGVVLVGSIVLTLVRMPAIAAASPRGTLESLGSREAAILMNNLLLVGAAAATFWGTIVPLLSEALRGSRIAVGAPFYQQVNGPIFLVLLALLGVGPGLGWRRTPRRRIERNLWAPVAVALVTSALLLLIGVPPGAALAAWGLCAFVAATVLLDLARGVRRGRRRRVGAYLAHLAIALIAAGVVGSSWFQDDRTVTLTPGETASIGRYAVRFDGLGVRDIGGGEGIWAALRVTGPGGALALRPERRAFVGWEDQAASGVAIATTWPKLDDVYVVLTGWETDGRASFHMFVNPLVCLIWAGGALLLGATALVAWPSGRPAEASSPLAAPLATAVPPLVEA